MTDPDNTGDHLQGMSSLPPTQPLPETDGWDEDAKAHPKVRRLYRVLVAFGLMVGINIFVALYIWLSTDVPTGDWVLSGETNSSLTKFIGQYPQVEALRLNDSPNLTDLTILDKLNGLKLLVISNCPEITQAQIDQLQKKLPDCEIRHEL